MSLKTIKNKTPLYVLLFLTVTISWGFCFIVMDKLTGDCNVPPLFLVACRFIIASLFVLLVRPLIKAPKFTKTELKRGFFAGLAMSAGFIFQCYGASMTTPDKCGMLTGTYVVLVPFFLMIINRKVNFKAFFDAIICLVGFGILYEIYKGFGSINLGDGLTLVGAMGFCTQFILLEKNAGKVHPVNFACMQLIVTAIISTILSLSTEIPSYSQITDWKTVVLGLLFTGVLGAGYAYVVQNFVQSKMKATTASVVSSTEAVFAVFFSLILGIVDLTWFRIVGSIVIMLSLLSSNLLPEEKIKELWDKIRNKEKSTVLVAEATENDVNNENNSGDNKDEIA